MDDIAEVMRENARQQDERMKQERKRTFEDFCDEIQDICDDCLVGSVSVATRNRAIAFTVRQFSHEILDAMLEKEMKK